ncbi:P-loop NTPase fold protein [Vibrio sp. SCSIO 43137]|uniref:P-loop NTPase fold protein n=1 Tax=Vibrio sp. SCSIO 43137 TaxID=3021011 RepID=UPI0023079C5D|nr:P-loop NTPase fold protein [Vibrio sp. SCSIO 43137]WCE31901.1 P-loop NTPase fold protein [Vibrio sp. SCSIO 43137]
MLDLKAAVTRLINVSCFYQSYEGFDLEEINKNVSSYLSYYYNLPYSPEYSIMLNGKWGAGKTWFIKDSLKLSKKKFLYVSLYGITSFEEIENSFFEQLHPILSSKGMKLTSKIAKGVLKATIKVDLDSDGKSDANVGSTVPDLKLPEYLTNTDNYILVFDDLERCSMNISDVMGYINHFVEHQGYKVIVLANEDEIHSTDDTYARVKEKLIGKTFKVKADIKSALTDFISDIKSEDVKCFYYDNFDYIISIFEKAKFDNLRHLKHSLWDFERLYSYFPSSSFKKQGLIEQLFGLFLCFSFESKGGSLSSESLIRLNSGNYSRLFSNGNAPKKTLFQIISDKYSMINFGETILELESWAEFVFHGNVEQERIEESICKSRYYQDENTASWVKLWRFLDMHDDDFDTVYSDVCSSIRNKEIDDVNVLKHIVGTFLSLSDMGIISKSRAEIVSSGITYVDFLKESGLLVKNESLEPRFIRNSSWGGLGFHEHDSDDFKEFSRYINEKTEESTSDKMPEVASELLGLMKNDNMGFVRKLIFSNHGQDTFYQTPILSHIDVDEFVTKLLSLNCADFRMTGYMFKERYSDDMFNSTLKSELPWLVDLCKALQEKQDNLSNKLSGYRIKTMLEDDIQPSIDILSKLETNG